MNATSLDDPRVRVQAEHGLGIITLARPEALNALDLAMVRAVMGALDAWQDDPDVQRVLLTGDGERGFCAGGDVRVLRSFVLAGDLDAVEAFFRAEYALNARIAAYPKPIVAFADGATMGGGMGLACHAAVRVVTERSRLAMPETRIGLTPDVGGSFLLARAPGRVGEYLALTGTPVGAADAIYAGLADHLVPHEHLSDLREALESRADPAGANELALLFDESPADGALPSARSWIDDAFAREDVPAILAALQERREPEAREAARTLGELSPTSLTITLASVRAARELPDLRAALAQEFRLVLWFARTQPDLLEGIRAQLVDKDRSPRWDPSSLAEVDADIWAQADRRLAESELWR